MERRPVPDTPFEWITDDHSRVFLLCTSCAGYERAFDKLARDLMRSRRTGKIRWMAQSPIMLWGAGRFILRHTHCQLTHRA